MAYIPLPNISDNKWSTLGGTTFEDNIDDLEIAWLQSAGATSDQVNDAWMYVFDLNSTATALTGTVTVLINTTAVTGVGTLFLTELSVGDKVKIGGEVHIVAAITDNLNLTLAEDHRTGAAGVVIGYIADLHWNNAAYEWLGGLGHVSESLSGRWFTFWDIGVLP